jgi:hypothetical protein
VPTKMNNLTSYTFSLLLVICILFSPLSVAAQQDLKLAPNSAYLNQELNYEMIGYEIGAERFWVVIQPSLTNSQEKLNKIIKDIFQRHIEKFELTNTHWNISFFTNKKEAGYKTFKADSYLGEYTSCNSPDEHYRNKVYVYPTNRYKVKWYYGPSIFSCNNK